MSLNAKALDSVTDQLGASKAIGETRPLFRRLGRGNRRFFPGSVSRINNLLTVIGGQAELLLEKIPPGSQIATRLTAILSASRRAADVLNSPEEAGVPVPGGAHPVELNEAIQAMLAQLYARTDMENIRFKIDQNEEPLPVCLNLHQFEPLIANLLQCLHVESSKGASVVVETAVASGAALPAEVAEFERSARYAVVSLAFSRAPDGTGQRRGPVGREKPVRGQVERGLFEICRLLQNDDGFATAGMVKGSEAIYRIYLPLDEET